MLNLELGNEGFEQDLTQVCFYYNTHPSLMTYQQILVTGTTIAGTEIPVCKSSSEISSSGDV